MGIKFNRREKARPFMATQSYNVEYEDGTKRVKLLHSEDATKLRDQNGVKKVTKKAQPAANKQRNPEGDK